MVSRLTSIIADFLVIVLTWVRTYRVYKLTSTVKLKTNLSELLLRDGTAYFLAVLAFNSVTMAFGTYTQITIKFADLAALSSIFMSRLMLDLREALVRSFTGSAADRIVDIDTEDSFLWDVDELDTRVTG
ncbi:uncharacterized protein FIBRA_02258 [Fibroporia radiculosa]|uniref:Uncharacterized protein n=1 Tax=Fibroporia radiculosa TaxID=599839 RepID=J4GMQ5_9APHY|nr:uncharacterized protein FIBRA_02258 [Fibroporia radiculosa]CCM00230.1 predicted protein [Fibroporia radiculosa]